MLEPLYFIVRSGGDVIAERRELLDMLFDICKTVRCFDCVEYLRANDSTACVQIFESSNRGEDELCQAAKLVEIIILRLVGKMDEVSVTLTEPLLLMWMHSICLHSWAWRW